MTKSLYAFAVLLGLLSGLIAVPLEEPAAAESGNIPVVNASNDTVGESLQNQSTSLLGRSQPAPAEEHVPVVNSEVVPAAADVPLVAQTRVSGDSVRKTSVRDIVARCYTCNSFEDPDKCKKIDKLRITDCDPNQHTCHYIVGTIAQNGKTEKNVVIAGCDSAPAAKIPMRASPILHTARGALGCDAFVFTEKDQGTKPAGAVANVDISFIGQTCVCESDAGGCNKDFTKLLSASGKNVVSVSVIFGALSLVLAVKHF